MMRLRDINAYNRPESSLEPPDCWDGERDYEDEEDMKEEE